MKTKTKRGRPSVQDLHSIVPDVAIDGRNTCMFCKRNFPRRKSLVSHLRTHTKEAPFACTYPECHWAFKQSGQLATHKGRHTGIKPFKCPHPGCTVRFLHNNRKCKIHDLKVKSDGELVWDEIPKDVTPEGRAWIIEQRAIEAQKRGEPQVNITSPLGMPLRKISSNSPSTKDQSYADQISIAKENDFENHWQRAIEPPKRGEPEVSTTSPLGMPLREISSNSPSTKDQSYVDRLSIAKENDIENLGHARTDDASFETNENNRVNLHMEGNDRTQNISSESKESNIHNTHCNLRIKGKDSPDFRTFERYDTPHSSSQSNENNLHNTHQGLIGVKGHDSPDSGIFESDTECGHQGRTPQEIQMCYLLLELHHVRVFENCNKT